MIYAVSDIHGCFKTFQKLLEKVNFDETKDTLYILGDIVDRGPLIWETYEWVKERINKNVFMIQGNHEDMLITDVFFEKGKTLRDKKNLSEKERKYVELFKENINMVYSGRYQIDYYGTISHLINNCNKTLDDLVDMCEFFASLPYYYVVNVNGKDIRLVHAYCRKDLSKTTANDFIWNRDFAETDTFCQGETVIYGHTPTEIYQNKGDIQIDINEKIDAVKINIDCGCVYNRKLCILRLDDMKYWYQKNIDNY